MDAHSPSYSAVVPGRALSGVVQRATKLSLPLRYFIAVLAAAGAVLLRLGLDPVWGAYYLFVVFLTAVMVSAWLGGLGPGLVTTLLSIAAIMTFWIDPAGNDVIGDRGDLLALFFFVLVAVLVSALNEAWRRSTVRAVEAELRQHAARSAAETSAHQLRSALQAGHMGTWEYTLETEDVRWSAELEAIHGYEPGGFAGSFAAFLQEIHPGDRDRVLETVRAAVQQRREHYVAYRVVRPDGALRWVEGVGQVICDAHGQPERMIGVCTDVTERKLNEERLADQAKLLELIDDATYEVDHDLSITAWGDAACRMYGYTAAETLGRRSAELLEPAITPAERAAYLQRLEAGEVIRFETTLRRKDGARRWVDVTAVAKRNRDQTTSSYVFIHRDITERKRAEERFRMAVEVAPAAMIMADPRGTIVLANALTERLLGYERNEIIGRSIEELVPERVRPRHAGYRSSFLAEAVQRHMGVGRDLYAVRKDGVEIPVEIGLSPIETTHGTFVLAAVTDITERKQGEEERARILEREQAARAELERASQLKDAFLAVLSHDLRTPLNAVLGYTELLRSGALPPERAAHAFDAIERNARAQVGLISSLLDLSRIIAGNLELELATVDMATTLDASIDAIRLDAENKGVTIHVLPHSGPAILVGDGARLQQVFWNLLSNAVKFTEPGGRVVVRWSVGEDRVRIEVTDDGRGITPEFLPYVFDRFRQAESPAGRHAGLGLGLAITREIVEAHGGSISAESAGDGFGSTFAVMLPITGHVQGLARADAAAAQAVR